VQWKRQFTALPPLCLLLRVKSSELGAMIVAPNNRLTCAALHLPALSDNNTPVSFPFR